MAIAVGVLVQIVLVIVLGGIEVVERQQFYSEAQPHLGLHTVIHRLERRHVGFVSIVDARAVLCALIVSLLIHAHGIDGLEVHLGQELQRDDLGIIGDAYGLGKTRLVGAHVLIGWILGMAVGIAHLGFYNSIHQFEIMLCTPEASSCKINLFHHIQCCFHGQRYSFFPTIYRIHALLSAWCHPARVDMAGMLKLSALSRVLKVFWRV